MTTTTRTETLQRVLDQGNPNTMGDVARLQKAGHMACVIKATVTGATSTTIQVITDLVGVANVTVAGIDLDDGEPLPAIQLVSSCRVTAGSASATLRQVADSGASATTSNVLLSDDGTTLTFEAAVTGFILVYTARSYTDMTDEFATGV